METFCYKIPKNQSCFAAELRQKRGREKVIVRHHGLLSPTPAGILGSEVFCASEAFLLLLLTAGMWKTHKMPH